MVETGMIGSKRLEYLDLANKTFAIREFQQASSYLESFLTTVRDNSKMSEEIKKEFDRIEKKRIETWDASIKNTEEMDSWTQAEIRSEGRIAIFLEALHDKIDTCWKIAMNNGAFND